MIPSAQLRTVVALLAVGIIAVVAWLSRPPMAAWTRARLARTLQSEIAAQPDDKAARLIRLIEEDEPEWLAVIIIALADSRPAVAVAAETRLVELLETWERSAPREKSSRVGAVAGLLAAGAPQLPPARVAFARALAQKLLAWPIDSRLVDAARLFADCQAILELPVPETADVRLAAIPLSAPTGRETPMPAAREKIAEPSPASVEEKSHSPAPTLLPPQRSASPTEVTAAPESAPLEQVSREPPLEPRRLTKPQATRITDK